MRTIQVTRRWPMATVLLLGSALLVVGVMGTIGGLRAAGVINWPFPKQQPGRTPLNTEGLIAVPVSVRDIPIYAKVTREDLLDPKTGELRIVHLSPEKVRAAGVKTQLEDILGHVVKRDKAAGYAFSSEDFFPKGTRPGHVAGIPPGKRAIALEADKLKGMVHALKAGDQVDLVSTIAVDGAKGAKMSGTDASAGAKKAAVKVVAERALVVAAVPPRKKDAKDVLTRQDQEIVLAVQPEELVLIETALALKAQLTCVPRSGQPEESSVERSIPSVEPKAPRVTEIETIHGGKREVLRFADREIIPE
jgi:Flp pilus assembly protein CpaB